MPTNDNLGLLNRLIRESGESPWLEFKVNNNNPETIGEWVSACANAAILTGKERAFLVFGIENKTKRKVGTTVKLQEMKKGAENFTNWLSRMIEPRLMMEFLDFESQGLHFSILTIEPTYDRPVRFNGTEYIRIGENTKKLAEFPEHERALWLATGRRKFESAIALPHQTTKQVLEKLDADSYYQLAREEMPRNLSEVMRRLSDHRKFLIL
jgi:predicted HTH transcriptional regulator